MSTSQIIGYSKTKGCMQAMEFILHIAFSYQGAVSLSKLDSAYKNILNGSYSKILTDAT